MEMILYRICNPVSLSVLLKIEEWLLKGFE